MFTKKDLFNRTKKLWPLEINLSGQSFDDRFVKGGQVLNEIYYRIESSLDENDDWMQISSWAFHQALSVTFRGESGGISIDEVSFELYERMMLENLNGDECWQAELKIYETLNIE